MRNPGKGLRGALAAMGIGCALCATLQAYAQDVGLPESRHPTTTAMRQVVLCGDPNGDGKITAGDALFALRAAVGTSVCSLAVCDYSGNGKVAASDALAILRKAVGQDVASNCPSSPTTPLTWDQGTWGQVTWN